MAEIQMCRIAVLPSPSRQPGNQVNSEASWPCTLTLPPLSLTPFKEVCLMTYSVSFVMYDKGVTPHLTPLPLRSCILLDWLLLLTQADVSARWRGHAPLSLFTA